MTLKVSVLLRKNPSATGMFSCPAPHTTVTHSAQHLKSHLIRKTEWMQKTGTFDTVANCLKVQPDYASLIHADEIVVQLDLPTLVRRQP